VLLLIREAELCFRETSGTLGDAGKTLSKQERRWIKPDCEKVDVGEGVM
jgi:hypothetical protein